LIRIYDYFSINLKRLQSTNLWWEITWRSHTYCLCLPLCLPLSGAVTGSAYTTDRWRQWNKAMRVDLSPRLGGHTVANQPPTTVLLSFTSILSPRNGVRSYSRCGTESWTELELAFHLTV